MLRKVRVCGQKNVANGTCVRVKSVANGTCVRVQMHMYVTKGTCVCAPKNMDHCEPNKPCHLPDWKIWMIDAGPFQVQTKSGNTWILLNTDQDRVQNFEV